MVWLWVGIFVCRAAAVLVLALDRRFVLRVLLQGWCCCWIGVSFYGCCCKAGAVAGSAFRFTGAAARLVLLLDRRFVLRAGAGAGAGSVFSTDRLFVWGLCLQSRDLAADIMSCHCQG